MRHSRWPSVQHSRWPGVGATACILEHQYGASIASALARPSERGMRSRKCGPSPGLSLPLPVTSPPATSPPVASLVTPLAVPPGAPPPPPSAVAQKHRSKRSTHLLSSPTPSRWIAPSLSSGSGGSKTTPRPTAPSLASPLAAPSLASPRAKMPLASPRARRWRMPRGSVTTHTSALNICPLARCTSTPPPSPPCSPAPSRRTMQLTCSDRRICSPPARTRARPT